MKKAFATIGFILLCLVIYLGVQVVISVAFGLVYGVMWGLRAGMSGQIPDLTAATEEISTFMLRFTNPIMLVSSVLTLLIYWLMLRKRPAPLVSRADFRAPGLITAALAVVLGIALNFFTNSWMTLWPLPDLFNQELFNNTLVQIVTDSLPIALLNVGIITPIFEEVLFRGIIQNRLRKSLSSVAAILVASLIFALFHLNLQQGVYAFYIGAVCGALYHRSQSLIVPILIHIVINSSSVLLTNTSLDFTKTGWGITLALSTLVLCVLLYLFFAWEKTKPYENKQEF